MLTRTNAFGQTVSCTFPGIRFVVDDDKNGKPGGKPKEGDKPQDDKSGGENPDRGYPANTPVKDMTLEQQNAYNAFHASKHENRVKALSDAFGGEITPEKVTELLAEVTDLRGKTQTDTEKLVTEAVDKAKAEVRGELAAERVKNALEKALTGRAPDVDALLSLDRSTLIKGDGVDAEKLAAWVEENSTEGTGAGKKHVDLGQGNRGTTAAEKGVSSGRDLFQSTRKTPTKPA